MTFRTSAPASMAGLLALALLATTGAPSPAAAQSLLSAGGLGTPQSPLDARARGLGSIEVGLSGWHLSPTDPAALAGLDLPTITGTLQPTATRTEGEAAGGGSRFPVLGVAYPFGRHVVTLQLGSFLDQEWEANTERQIVLAGEEVTAWDRYQSLGGIGQVRLGWAVRLGEQFAVGASAGSYVGSVERHFTRELDADAVGPGVEAYRTRGRWHASGATLAAGASWDPSELVRVAAGVEWGDELTLDPVAPTTGEKHRYPMPLTLRAGGTVTLVPGLALALGTSRSDWSGVDEALGGGVARSAAWGLGTGLEWTESRLAGRELPLRVGYGRRDLPFHFDGEPASESHFSGGVGIDLSRAETASVARFDLTLERGTRSAGAFSEDYWRTSLSMRLAGS